jgi:hypothetical protein
LDDIPAAKGSDEPVALHYAREVGWSGAVTLELVRGGASTLVTSFNHDGRPEIGCWQGPLPEGHFATALASMRAVNYQQLDGPHVLRPGAKRVSLGERASLDEVPRLRSLEPDLSALAAVNEAMEAAMSELRAHPLRVVEGKVTVPETRVERGRAFAFTVALTNIGRAPLDLSSPRGQEAGAWSGLRLAFRNGREDERQVNLTPADLEPEEVEATATITLAPGQTLELRVCTEIDVPRGQYDLRVEYHGLGEGAGGPSLVAGSLWLPIGPVEVVRGGWRKLWQ